MIMIMISKVKRSTFLCAALSLFFFGCSSTKSSNEFFRFTPLRGQVGYVPPSVDTHKIDEKDTYWPIPKGSVFTATDISESEDPDIKKLKGLHFYINGQLLNNRFLYSSVISNEKHLDKLLVFDNDSSSECTSSNCIVSPSARNMPLELQFWNAILRHYISAPEMTKAQVKSRGFGKYKVELKTQVGSNKSDDETYDRVMQKEIIHFQLNPKIKCRIDIRIFKEHRVNHYNPWLASRLKLENQGLVESRDSIEERHGFGKKAIQHIMAYQRRKGSKYLLVFEKGEELEKSEWGSYNDMHMSCKSSRPIYSSKLGYSIGGQLNPRKGWTLWMEPN